MYPIAMLSVLLASAAICATIGQQSASSPLNDTIRAPIVEAADLRFRKLSNSQNLSQVRVDEIAQDAQGFMWFGTWNGLNRYDGYKFKAFKHEAGHPESLSGVFVYALFKDRMGNLWVGTDQFLDRFDPRTESFRHYRFDKPHSKGIPTVVRHISQDARGILWLSTQNGLFRLDPDTEQLKNFRHDPADPVTIGDNDVKSTGEDRDGNFWVATSQSFDEFDRNTGKVVRHIQTGESGIGFWFHEDRYGVFWIIYGSMGRIATLDKKTSKLTHYDFDWPDGSVRENQAYSMLEDREGTMWFGTASAGLMKFDRQARRFLSYRHRPDDSTSIGESRINVLFQDQEGSIWIGLHQVEPNYFRSQPLPFQDLSHSIHAPNWVGAGLVSAIFEDRRGVLWMGVNRQLQWLDRKTGRFSTLAETANAEVLSVVEDGPDVLWFGNARPGLLRLNLRTGEQKGYRHNSADPTTLCSGIVQQLLIDRQGALWAATWDGLCQFDAKTERFTRYRPDPNTRGLNYYTIAQDPAGALWLGGNLGLHRFDPKTKTFTVYSHDSDDPASVSDNRINSVFFDHSGSLWVGTQNGLDRFDPVTRTFKNYSQRNGMAGNVVSCILEDNHSVLWMSTNKGISSFKPVEERFANYTPADGLPGPDLTGWGSCYKNVAGEMFFGGFSGATSFFPDQIKEDTYVPPVALTDFRLFGIPVAPGAQSLLKAAVSHTEMVRLTHEQTIFSIEFSALSYLNPSTSRYRYRLDPLEKIWHEVGSDERLATYTTLPAGDYTFRLQAATSRGPWSPEVMLAIQILPPLWKTLPFQAFLLVLLTLLVWAAYRARLKRISEEFSLRLEERVGERTRIAQELHDTLLQNITGLALQISGLSKSAAAPDPIRERLKDLKRQAEDCLREARQSVWDIRSPDPATINIAAELSESGKQFTAGKNTTFEWNVVGEPWPLSPETAQQVLRIGREAIGNAAQHSQASRICLDLAYDAQSLTLRIADDGHGFDLKEAEHLHGHFGLATMRERAGRISASITIQSGVDQGTRIEVVVPRRK